MESDGVNEIFDDLLRQALMIAGRLGEQAARARQQWLLEQKAVSEQAGAEATARLAAEQAAARVALAPVMEDTWWASASPEQIGAAYETTTAWRDQDPDIAATHDDMNRRLAAQNIFPASGSPQQLTELLQAKQWAARTAPDVYAAYNYDLIRPQTVQHRERMNNQLVASWLSSPEAPSAAQSQNNELSELDQAREWATEHQPEVFARWKQRYDFADTVEVQRSAETDLIRQWQASAGTAAQPSNAGLPSQGQGDHQTQLTHASEWAAEHQPTFFAEWTQRHNFADTVADERRDETKLIERWQAAIGTVAPTAKPDFSRSADLRSAAYFKEAAARSANRNGDAASARKDDLLDGARDPSTDPDTAAGLEREARKEELTAEHNWDTAERRAEFAQSLHGKADAAAVDARVLADISQGTHPTAAVKGGRPNAPTARKNTAMAHARSVSKGGR